MEVTPVAGGAVQITLEPKEAQIFASMIANEVVGDLGRGENGLAQGLLEMDSADPFWDSGASIEDAAIFAYSILKRLDMFNDKQEMLMRLLDPQEA